jgi:uncharacterized protein (TIGR02118 family)
MSATVSTAATSICQAFAMQSVVILYPRSDDSHFDMDYYTSTHMPMFAEALGEICQGWGVMQPSADYHAMAWAMVDSMEAFGAAMKERGGPVLADVPNYTNTQPQMLTGPVVAGSQ